MSRCAASLMFLLLSLGLFGAAVDPRTTLIDGGTDAFSFIWFLQWWPWAIGRGLDPLVTHLIWFPQGYNLAWATPVPTAALLALPVTELVNGVAAYNFLILLAPALAAWTGFLLAEWLTRDWTAAVVTGMLFGFSPYIGGQMHGHPNLALAFLIPVAVLFAVQRAEGALSAGGFIGRLALVLVLQFGLSVEVFASLCLFGSAAALVFVLAVPYTSRRVALRLALEIVFAGLVASIALMPYLAHMAAGSGAFQDFVNSPRAYSTDLLNFVFPTGLTWLSFAGRPDIAARFTGNGSEQGGYLGLPLFLLLGLYARAHGREPGARTLLVVLAVAAVASLGPFLWIGGHALPVPLPWLPMTYLPLLRGALPARFSLYVALAAALAAGLWLAAARTPAERRQRLALAAIACAAVLPMPGSLPWQAAPTLPFFSPASVHTALGDDANIVLLPYAALGPGMLWQAQSGMAFTQSGGNLSFIPKSFQQERILAALYGLPLTDNFANDLTAFCAEHRVSAVVVGPGTPPALVAGLEQLAWATTESGGVRVYRVPQPAAMSTP